VDGLIFEGRKVSVVKLANAHTVIYAGQVFVLIHHWHMTVQALAVQRFLMHQIFRAELKFTDPLMENGNVAAGDAGSARWQGKVSSREKVSPAATQDAG
tara:strand:- start:655 stop:951 length:297 start_codon:yes stop_codon:yes gene_type:complete